MFSWILFKKEKKRKLFLLLSLDFYKIIFTPREHLTSIFLKIYIYIPGHFAILIEGNCLLKVIVTVGIEEKEASHTNDWCIQIGHILNLNNFACFPFYVIPIETKGFSSRVWP